MVNTKKLVCKFFQSTYGLLKPKPELKGPTSVKQVQIPKQPEAGASHEAKVKHHQTGLEQIKPTKTSQNPN